MEKTKIIDIKNIVVRFSGDSGDGMQLVGNIFSSIAAITGNQIATFPDYPSEIRAPQGMLYGVSGFQVHLGSTVYSSGEGADVLVAMNPAALKVNIKQLTSRSLIIVDADSFNEREMSRAEFKSENAFAELGIEHIQRLEIPITTLTKAALEGFDLTEAAKSRSKNMFTLGLVCWLFGKSLERVNDALSTRFGKRPQVLEANLKVLADGYNYGENGQLSIPTYRVESVKSEPGTYIDVTGNQATAYGLVAASEKSGRPLFLGSYPITPATDILQELSKLKSLGVKTVQAEDEIAGICTAIGASFAGHLAVTTTSGPGLALKSEALGLAVMTELPLVVIDVQRGGPSTGMPTKSEQTDFMQAMYGRNGESPLVLLASSSPTNCFKMSYWAAKLAMEHMTPVVLLSDAYVANGSSAWRVPDESSYMKIEPHDVSKYRGDNWSLSERDQKSLARYWAKVGESGFAHRIGGLEKDIITGTISSDPQNHQKMVDLRRQKIETIADYIPSLEVSGSPDAELLIVGWGGSYGHLTEAVTKMNKDGGKVAYTHFNFLSPLPKNTGEILRKYRRIIVAEQNSGMFASHLRSQFLELTFGQYNRIEGRPFVISEMIEHFSNELDKLK